MKLIDLLEVQHQKTANPLSGAVEDDISMAVEDLKAIIVKIEALPGEALTKPIAGQLKRLSRAYQAEIAQRQRSRAL